MMPSEVDKATFMHQAADRLITKLEEMDKQGQPRSAKVAFTAGFIWAFLDNKDAVNLFEKLSRIDVE